MTITGSKCSCPCHTGEAAHIGPCSCQKSIVGYCETCGKPAKALNRQAISLSPWQCDNCFWGRDVK